MVIMENIDTTLLKFLTYLPIYLIKIFLRYLYFIFTMGRTFTFLGTISISNVRFYLNRIFLDLIPDSTFVQFGHLFRR